MNKLASASLFLCLLFSSSAFAGRKHRAVISVNTSSIPAPIDNEVCFAPDEHCDWKLEKFVMTAKQSLDVAIYDINLDKLVHEILVASKKIKVRIIVDKRQSKGSHSLVPLLIKAGADVRYGHQRGIMHDKFVVLDGHRLETGSFNYTNHASEANQENQVYLSTPSIVQRYQQRFEKMWGASTSALEE